MNYSSEIRSPGFLSTVLSHASGRTVTMKLKLEIEMHFSLLICKCHKHKHQQTFVCTYLPFWGWGLSLKQCNTDCLQYDLISG